MLNDDRNNKDIVQQFSNENINVALICALLFTAMLPLYYGESYRILDPDDTFSIGISESFLGNLDGVYTGSVLFYTIFDLTYFFAAAASFCGTFIGVLYALAANVVQTEVGMSSYLHYMGAFVSAPYLFLQISLYSWGVGFCFHAVYTPITVGGFIGKVLGMSILIIPLLCCIFYSVRAAHYTKDDVIFYKPSLLSDDEIASKTKAFFQDSSNYDLSVENFLEYLSIKTEHNYRIPLHVVTRVKALRAYKHALAATAFPDETFEDVQEYLDN
jgi:hypothetical protein